MEFTQCTPKIAEQVLAASEWHLQRALESFLTTSSSAAAAAAATETQHVDRRRIEKLFERYKDKRDDRILPTGTIALLGDLAIPHEDIRALILAWRFDAKTQGEFT